MYKYTIECPEHRITYSDQMFIDHILDQENYGQVHYRDDRDEWLDDWNDDIE